jgi:hypothetical protein
MSHVSSLLMFTATKSAVACSPVSTLYHSSRTKPLSFACSTCLRNPPQYPSLASFDNEYARLPDSKSVGMMFNAKAKALDKLEGTLNQIRDIDPLAALTGMLPSGFALNDYYAFQPSGRDQPSTCRTVDSAVSPRPTEND